MISINVSPDVEKQFAEVVRNNYDGDTQTAIVSLLKLHQKYGWKEQFRQDVDAVRDEIRRSGGIKSEQIAEAVKRYRKSSVDSDV